jgi:hypothetical protein
MSLELLTILDQDGKAQKGKDPNLPGPELQKLYRLMVQTRTLDDRGLALPPISAPPTRCKTATGCSRPTASPASCCCARCRCT